jgi:hypothetical protein
VSWEPINWITLGERPPVQPTIAGLVYPGRRHVFSGPPESAKTWAAFCMALEHIREDGTVLHVDFEMFAYETRDRLRSLGATAGELERFLHVEPDRAATDALVAELVYRWKPTLAIIDAAAGAYDLQGLDDHKRQDVEQFARTMIEPFRIRDVATITLDHVTKNAETRGRFSIGSERKIGGADVHLGFDTVVPFGRGRTGLVRVTTHKDRFGYLPRPRAAELELRSDHHTGRVAWTFQPAENAPDDWRPTVLMEKVSRFLEAQSAAVSRNVVEGAKLGTAAYVRRAMDELVAAHFVDEVEGPRRARLLRSTKPFRTSSDFVGTSSDEVVHDLVTSSSPYKGDEDEVDEHEVERLDLVRQELGL